jgi:integrase
MRLDSRLTDFATFSQLEIPAMSKKTAAAVVEYRNIRISIFERVDVKNGKEYQAYYFTQTISGKRVHKRASSLDKAKAEARRLINTLTLDRRDTRVLTDGEYSDYAAAIQIIRQHPGATLASAIGEWNAARKALGEGSIVAACESHRKTTLKRSGYTPALVSAVYDEFIESLERDGASDRYLEDCRSRMGQLKNTFRGFVHAVERVDLENWLNAKKISVKTRKNYRAAAVTLWSYAKTRGYLPPDQQTEAELITNRKRTKAARLATEIGVYEPADLRKILEAAPAHLLPVFAIGAFAGLRSSEIYRLKWNDIHPSYIQVDAEDSKTAVKRHAPVTIALKEWLARCPRPKDSDTRLCGRYSAENALARAMTKAIRDAEVLPVLNGLRHTFCSARVAATDNVKQTSREAGNSPAIILQHYVKVMTRAKGHAWFNIRPSASTSEKVVSFAA